MKKEMKWAACLTCACVAAGVVSCGRTETKKARNLPPGPAFASVATPEDGGKVIPVDRKSPTPLRIAVLGLENNPFWIPVKRGTLKAAEELKPLNCTVEWIVPAGDKHTADVFGSAIESAVVQEYDAIVTIAGDSGTASYIKRAVQAGIPVATFNSETETLNPRLFFVGADLYKQGETGGKAMVDATGATGKVALITGFFSVEAHELRRKGFKDYLAKNAPGLQIVAEVESKDKADLAYAATRDFVTAHPDLVGVFVTAGGNFGAAKAIEESGKAGQIKIVCFDFVDETMGYVKKGVIAATIGQDPFAQGHDPAVRLFNYLVGGVVPPAGKLLTRSDIVTKDNIAEFWSEPAQ